MMIAIEGGTYDTATEAFSTGNQLAALHYDNLTGKLTGYSAMAGDDSTSTEFAAVYDEGAQDAVDTLGDLVDSFANLGRLTDVSVTNHRNANRSSILLGATVYDGCSSPPAGGYVDVLPITLPSALGGDLSALPDELSWILDEVQGFVWPNADTDRLREAGRAWKDAGDSVADLTRYCDSAVRIFHGQRSPEVPVAIDATNDLGSMTRDLGEHFNTIGQACEDYADDVEEQRRNILDLLWSLLRDAVIIEGIGIVLGAVTAGITAAGACAINAAKIAAEAPKFLRIIEFLRTLASAGAQVIRAARAALRPLRATLLRFKEARTARAAGDAAETVSRREFPGGGLDAHERGASHTIKKHVGKTDDELKARLQMEPIRQLASSYTSQDVAEHAISDVMAARQSVIDEWLTGSRRRLELDGEAGSVIGRVAIRETGEVVEATRLRIVLVRDDAMPDGYRILTSFPKP
jgi:hypothetical protein